MSRLVHIRYRDHVLFRDADPSLYRPAIRECVGWVIKENDEAVWVLWDRSVEPLPHETMRPEESGLVILKSDILELRRLE
jgi:hypothetical protein